MARPARPWFRLYVEAVHDRKLRRLKPEHRWLFVVCLAIARQSPVPGVLLVGENDPMGWDDLIDIAAMPASSVRAGMAALCETGIVKWGEDDVWSVPAFSDRQYESDSSAERVRKHRSKEQGCNGETSLPVTPPETETEAETENTLAHDKRAGLYEADFDAWYAGYPRKIGRADALKLYRARRREGIDPERLTKARDEYAKAVATSVSGSTYVKYPATFLAKDGPWMEWENGPPEGFVSPVAPYVPTTVKPDPKPTTRLVGGVTQRFMPGAGWISEGVG